MKRFTSTPFKILLSLLFLVLSILVLEGASSAFLSWQLATAKPKHPQRFHCEHDPLLGWINIPDLHVEDHFGKDIHLTINSQRIRGERDYTPAKAPGTFRIICTGDSFTMGSGVSDGATYPAQLEALAPSIETINMGLAGYGVGQAYLWYKRDGLQFQADALVLSVIGDDFYRMRADGNVTDNPKPELALVDGQVEVLNEPVPTPLGDFTGRKILERLWKKSALGRYGLTLGIDVRRRRRPPTQEGFAPVAEAIFKELKQISDERDQTFLFCYLPTLGEVEAGRASLYATWLEPLLNRLEIPSLSLLPAFMDLTPDQRNTHYLRDGHYSALGQALVAERLLAFLREHDPGAPR